MRLILIPCSNAKRPGGTKAWSPELTAATRLGSAGHSLMEARADIGKPLHEHAGADLGADGVPPPLLPAMARYDGLICREAGVNGWNNSTLERFADEGLIVSGLYGLVGPLEPIRYYNCCMKSRLPNGMTAATWWRRRGLGRWLRHYIDERGISDVYSLLSAAYEYSLGGLTFGRDVRVHRIEGGPGFAGLRVQGRALAHLMRTGECPCLLCAQTVSHAL